MFCLIVQVPVKFFMVFETSLSSENISCIDATQVFSLSSLPETKISEFANNVDLDEVAHNEPPHPGLHCLHSSLRIPNMIQSGLFFRKFADVNFVVCCLAVKEFSL